MSVSPLGTRGQRRYAAAYDDALRRDEQRWLGAMRRRLLTPLSGTVLELGAGTGANLVHYPRGLQRLVLAEPSPAMRDRLTQRARGFEPAPVIVDADAAHLDQFTTGAFDAVVCTLVLCSVDDPTQTVDQLRRTLKPGGRLVVIEHVRASGWHGRVQDAITPLTRIVIDGCRQNRDTAATLAHAGFAASDVGVVHEAGPGFVRPIIAGTLTR